MSPAIKIAIPSYKRSETLCKKTLHFLKSHEIPADSIYVFVEPEQRATYEAAIMRHHPDYLPNMCEGRPGTAGQRRAIEDYFTAEKIVCMDDDVAGLKMMVPLPLAHLFSECFRIAEEQKCALWGFHPSDNALSMKDQATVGLSYIIGSCFGMHTKYLLDYPNNLTEDFERTMQYYRRDGRVIRFNGVGIRTKYFGVGGLEEFRVNGAQEAAMHAFHQRYADFCRLRVREGKPTDVVIQTIAHRRIDRPFRNFQ